jgi:hypothetical protein
MRIFPLLLSLILLPVLARAEAPALLRQAADKWMGERDNWAFTVSVREFEGNNIKEERSERYDPSKPGAGRWELLAVNGKPPTAERREEWLKRKTKKRKNPGKALDEYFDFDHATVVSEDAAVVRYHLPLQNAKSWLFPVDKVTLRITVNKSTQAIEKVGAGIDEPFRVALGLAHIMDVDLAMQFDPYQPVSEAGEPSAANPEGKAKVVVSKLGQRMEYAWSDFKRVTPHPDNVVRDEVGKEER